MMYSVQQAAAKVGISEGLLILWIETKRIVPSVNLSTSSHALTGNAKKAFESVAPDGELFGWDRFQFTGEDIERLQSIVESTARKRVEAENSHKAGAHYTPQELAGLWGLSADTIRELFENEAGVIVIGHNGNRRKRGYRTLRIPESVAVRVQRRLSNL